MCIVWCPSLATIREGNDIIVATIAFERLKQIKQNDDNNINDDDNDYCITINDNNDEW